MLDNCPERLRLSNVVGEAISKMYKARADFDAARKAISSDIDGFASELLKTQSAERDAERELREHVEQHQCRR